MSYADNPRAPRDDTQIEEGTGTITSDSLAAESIASGGDFGANQSNVVASGQPSRGFTGNTTDTSGATVLSATTDGPSRGSDTGSSYRTPGDNSRDTATLESSGVGAPSSAYDTTRGGPQDSYGGDAPSSYSAAAGGSENYKPGGQNITEGGFDSDAPNASFNNDIGGKNDPGRVAELGFQKTNASAGADSGYAGANQGSDGAGGQGGFENLDNETSS